MSSRVLRFWTFEHAAMMIAAVLLAHIAHRRIRRQVPSGFPHRTAAVFFGLSLLLVVAGIPWPFLPLRSAALLDTPVGTSPGRSAVTLDQLHV